MSLLKTCSLSRLTRGYGTSPSISFIRTQRATTGLGTPREERTRKHKSSTSRVLPDFPVSESSAPSSSAPCSSSRAHGQHGSASENGSLSKRVSFCSHLLKQLNTAKVFHADHEKDALTNELHMLQRHLLESSHGGRQHSLECQVCHRVLRQNEEPHRLNKRRKHSGHAGLKAAHASNTLMGNRGTGLSRVLGKTAESPPPCTPPTQHTLHVSGAPLSIAPTISKGFSPHHWPLHSELYAPLVSRRSDIVALEFGRPRHTT